MPKKKTDFDLKIINYYNKYCKDKGLIFVKSGKRTGDAGSTGEGRERRDSKIIFYDFTFRFKEKEICVTFSDDDDDIGGRIKQVLRENDIYL